MVCLRSAALGKHPFHQLVAVQPCSPCSPAVDHPRGFIAHQSLCQKARGNGKAWLLVSLYHCQKRSYTAEMEGKKQATCQGQLAQARVAIPAQDN